MLKGKGQFPQYEELLVQPKKKKITHKKIVSVWEACVFHTLSREENKLSKSGFSRV